MNNYVLRSIAMNAYLRKCFLNFPNLVSESLFLVFFSAFSNNSFGRYGGGWTTLHSKQRQKQLHRKQKIWLIININETLYFNNQKTAILKAFYTSSYNFYVCFVRNLITSAVLTQNVSSNNVFFFFFHSSFKILIFLMYVVSWSF